MPSSTSAPLSSASPCSSDPNQPWMAPQMPPAMLLTVSMAPEKAPLIVEPRPVQSILEIVSLAVANPALKNSPLVSSTPVTLSLMAVAVVE